MNDPTNRGPVGLALAACSLVTSRTPFLADHQTADVLFVIATTEDCPSLPEPVTSQFLSQSFGMALWALQYENTTQNLVALQVAGVDISRLRPS